MTERLAYGPGQYWYSKLKDFQKCPRFYELKHVKKVPTPEEKSADLAFGTAIHAAVNHHLESGSPGLEVFNLMWKAAATEGLGYGRYKHHELQHIADVLLPRFERLHAKKFKPVSMEERLFHPDVPFEGTPDFLGEYDGVPSVVDFKTSAYPYHNMRIFADDQMPGYGWLSEKCKGYPVRQRVYVVFVKNWKEPRIQTILAPMDGGDVTAAAENVLGVVEDIKASCFPKNSSACIMGERVCPYFARCTGIKEIAE